MELRKGYAKEDVEDNIAQLIADGSKDNAAIQVAVSYARARFKRDYPESVAFPDHLKPGNIAKTYRKEE